MPQHDVSDTSVPVHRWRWGVTCSVQPYCPSWGLKFPTIFKLLFGKSIIHFPKSLFFCSFVFLGDEVKMLSSEPSSNLECFVITCSATVPMRVRVRACACACVRAYGHYSIKDQPVLILYLSLTLIIWTCTVCTPFLDEESFQICTSTFYNPVVTLRTAMFNILSTQCI
jgi:hypothetical protein